MAVRIGISPIAWQNDDLPQLTAAFTMDQALAEASAIGYAGVERGRRMPADTEGLRAYLDTYHLQLCGGWCSGNLLVNDLAGERAAIRDQVDQFAALGAPCIVYAECSNTVQGIAAAPLASRPKMARDEIAAYARKLGELAQWTADRGVPLAYHHHMGSIIQDGEDIDWLMDAAPGAVHLLYDTGHLWFGGADVLGVLDRWADRILHVHFKDVRPDVIARIRADNGSFLDAVVAGAFTVPGDGVIDFAAVAGRLARMDYSGWIVVEAEQDPASAPPFDYSRMGFEHIAGISAAAGLAIDRKAG